MVGRDSDMDEMGAALRTTRTPGGRFWVLSGCIELSTVLYCSSLSWGLTYRVGEEKVNKNEEKSRSRWSEVAKKQNKSYFSG